MAEAAGTRENTCILVGVVLQMRFVDGAKWWVRDDGPIKSLTDLWDGALLQPTPLFDSGQLLMP